MDPNDWIPKIECLYIGPKVFQYEAYVTRDFSMAGLSCI